MHVFLPKYCMFCIVNKKLSRDLQKKAYLDCGFCQNVLYMLLVRIAISIEKLMFLTHGKETKAITILFFNTMVV